MERRRKNAAKSQTLFGGRRRAADGPVAPGPGLYAGLAPARGQHGNPGVLQRDLDSLAGAGAGGDGVPRSPRSTPTFADWKRPTSKAACPISVSYTHLDVYKRQRQDTPIPKQ